MAISQQWWKQCVSNKIIVFINDKILNKHTYCEQVVFIKGWKKNVLEIEMAGGEFCGNAIRSVMYYLNVTQGKTNAKIKYTNYCFVVDCECVNSDCSFKVKQRDLIKNIIEIGAGDQIVWYIDYIS